MNNGSLIDRAPMQTYGSALVFCPMSSAIRTYQWKERLPVIEHVRGVIETNNALLQTLEGHTSEITAIAFSPNGKMTASGSQNGTIQLWDTATGTLQQTLKFHNDCVMAVAFSSDGKTLLFVSNERSLMWLGYRILSVTLSADSRTPAARSYDSVIQLNAQKWGQRASHPAAIASFSLDGKTLALGIDDSIQLWSAATGVHLQTLPGDNTQIEAIAFSPDAMTLALGQLHGYIRLWDVATCEYSRRFKTPAMGVRDIAFRPDGKTLVLGSRGSNAVLLDATTGAFRQTVMGRSSVIAFSPDNKMMASGSDDSAIRLWDAEIVMNGQIINRAKSRSRVRAIAFSPDGKMLASTSGTTIIQLWDTRTGMRGQTIECPEILGTAIAFSPNSKALASGLQHTWLWDIETGICRKFFKGPLSDHYSVSAIAFSPDENKLAVGINDRTIQLRDVVTGVCLQTFHCYIHVLDVEVTAIAFSPDSRTLASAHAGKKILIWDVVSGAMVQTLHNALPRNVHCRYIAFSPDGRHLRMNHGCIRNWRQPDADIPSEPQEENLLLSLDGWITKGGTHHLWLHRDYRKWCVAVHDNIVAFGHESEVVFLLFNF